MNKDVKLQVFPVVCTDRVSIIAKSAGWPQFGGKEFKDLSGTFNYLFHTHSSDVLSRQRVFTASFNKKLSYRRGTAQCVVSIEILPIATQQCRNYLYDKS